MHAVDHRPAEGRALLGQQLDPVVHRVLLVRGQVAPPLQELVGDLDLPHFRILLRTHLESRLIAVFPAVHCRRPIRRGRSAGAWPVGALLPDLDAAPLVIGEAAEE